ncbi:hypothetical protein AVEN_144848-1 [Araneus ventricosus]|uniref:Sulfatase N-terminal domain-containing protein n=1 Tax=Araneus ventricosus TaxID=182803 RepID=A0A4Y2UN89_ARAVE|nr:hypothetical protein AVEN_232034-1 [Araneus ventricosus]GBO14147.1 hypothetical protein AVEN_144848-1 [Araneus ventricosus]
MLRQRGKQAHWGNTWDNARGAVNWVGRVQRRSWPFLVSQMSLVFQNKTSLLDSARISNNSYVRALVSRVLEPAGIPLKFAFLPEKLKELRYSTHIIGKWHLGHCNKSYTPMFRGFDSFLGFYYAETDYYKHTIERHGGLVVRSWLRDRKIPGSRPNCPEDSPCMGAVARCSIIRKVPKVLPLVFQYEVDQGFSETLGLGFKWDRVV